MNQPVHLKLNQFNLVIVNQTQKNMRKINNTLKCLILLYQTLVDSVFILVQFLVIQIKVPIVSIRTTNRN
jgi:hypothetical protein